jgi:hypothetical protein
MSTEKNKIKALFDAKKREGGAREFTYKTVADKMNEQFKRVGVKESISEQQLKYIVNGQTDLSVAKGLALATVLGCSFVDFLPDEVTELASFESELIFDSPEDVNNYFFEQEQLGRMIICSHFPTYVYLSPLEYFKKSSSKMEQLIHKKRVTQLKSARSYTTEYYEIQAVLNFIFSPFYSNFSKKEKLIIIDNYLKMFPLKKRKNSLLFFSANMQYRRFSSYHLNHTKYLITMGTPLDGNCFLQIKNKVFFDKTSQFIELNKNITWLNPEESVLLLQRLKQLLISYEKLDCQAIIDFYKESDEKLQSMIYGNVKHLLSK